MYLMKSKCSMCNATEVDADTSGANLCPDCAAVGEVARLYSLPSVNLRKFELDGSVVSALSRSTAKQLGAIAINQYGSTLVVAMANPTHENVKRVQAITHFEVEPVVASRASIEAAYELL